MFFRRRQFDPKTRRQIALANACLAVALIMRYCVHPTGTIAMEVFDGVYGLMIGISIGVNFFVLRSGRGCRESRDPNTMA